MRFCYILYTTASEARGGCADPGNPLVGVQLTYTDGEYCREGGGNRQVKCVPSTLNPQPSTLNPQPSTLNPQPSSLIHQPSTLNTQLSTLKPQPSTVNQP